jgi:hypothetical protein
LTQTMMLSSGLREWAKSTGQVRREFINFGIATIPFVTPGTSYNRLSVEIHNQSTDTQHAMISVCLSIVSAATRLRDVRHCAVL